MYDWRELYTVKQMRRRDVISASKDASVSKRVGYVYPYAFQYRLEFHERMRAVLAEHGVEYNFIYCSKPNFPDRGDFRSPNWAISVPCSYIKIGRFELRYQHAWNLSKKLDLVIIQQENGLLLNYPLQILRKILGIKVAFFGHGRNFQSDRSGGLRELFKKFWIGQIDWWFAYTQLSAAVVEEAGFPSRRITVFNNAIDVLGIREQVDAIDKENLEILRANSYSGSRNIGIFIGGLYSLKRIEFLIQAAKLIRAKVPDFELLIVGGGSDFALVKEAASEFKWIHALGPRFGEDKTRLACLAKVMLMPGLVGLSILDSFAYRTPMVTTSVNYHSPEIDYLKNGYNGVIVDASDSIEGYAEAVIQLFENEDLRQQLCRGADESLEKYTIEEMVGRFSKGVLEVINY